MLLVVVTTCGVKGVIRLNGLNLNGVLRKMFMAPERQLNDCVKFGHSYKKLSDLVNS